MGFGSFIPNRISNRTVAGFLEFLRRIQRRFRIAWRYAAKHLYSNRIAVDRMLGSFGEREEPAVDRSGPDCGHSGPNTGLQGILRTYLEYQNNYRDIAYGRTDMAYAGCEIIAVYNALLALLDRVDLQDLISAFERDGMVLSARFGTAPYAIRDYLTGRGYPVVTVLDPREFDETADKSAVSILMMYNDRRNIFKKIHTVCITRGPRGYVSHNTYGDGRLIGPFGTVTELVDNINCGYARGIVMFGVGHKDTGDDIPAGSSTPAG